MAPSRVPLPLKAKLFRGLGDSSRLAILEALRGGARSVGEVAARTGLGQPNASMHLDCLWCCGLVERETRGRFTYYRIKGAKVERILASAERLLEDVRGHIEECSNYREKRA